jgi:hypothetical protein
MAAERALSSFSLSTSSMKPEPTIPAGNAKKPGHEVAWAGPE